MFADSIDIFKITCYVIKLYFVLIYNKLKYIS
jgi:hypothetical protein